MKILPPNIGNLVELNRLVKANFQQRQPELANVSGLRWLVMRIKIEIWAWRKAFREVPRNDLHRL